MIYLLDTNTCIRYLNPGDNPVHRIMKSKRREEIAVCSIVICELYYGAYKSSRRESNLSLLDTFFSQIQCVEFTREAAKQYGIIRLDLEQKGTPIGAYDLLIAAHALAWQATLVTHNIREFSRVANLQLEDWES